MPDPQRREAPDPTAEAAFGRLTATVERLRRELREERRTADRRALVELAKGVLVERLHCGPAQAAHQLAALAAQSGRPTEELAADIVNEAARDGLAEVVAEPAGPADGPTVLRLRTAESGVLAASDSPAVATALLEHALAPLGATAVAIWELGPDGVLALAGSAGFGPGEAERWRHVPPGVPTLAGRVLADRRASWVRDLRASGLPSIGQAETTGGRAVCPAVVGGRIVGVLEICWPQPLEPQPSRVQRQIEALADLCAHTMDTGAPTAGDLGAEGAEWASLAALADNLPDPALVLTPEPDGEGRLVDFWIRYGNASFREQAGQWGGAVTGRLLESYPQAAEPDGLFEQIARTHATGRPFRARRGDPGAPEPDSTAGVTVSRIGGGILVVRRTEDEPSRVAELLRHAQRLGRIGGFEENLTTGEVTWSDAVFELHGLPLGADPVPVEQLAAHAHPDDAVAVGRFLRTLLHHQRDAATGFRLQRGDGVARHIRVVAEPIVEDGRLVAVRGAYQDVSAQYWTEVALAATQDQLAHSEQQSAERNRLALQLQHAIMPPSRGPMDVEGLSIAVRYRPAERGHLVGGDWYDAAVLPSGQILLCVGDVAGHGIPAATGMVALRNALRGLAATGAGPGQLLTWLNGVAHQLTDNVTATAVCGLFDPRTRQLRWARAGHPPPVLLTGGEAVTLPMVKGLLLGTAADARYEEGQLQLHVGETLLLYTDGLVERRDRALQESTDQLLATVRAGSPTATLERRLDHVLTHSNSDTDDDTCLLGIQVR
ncbi:SpoIIE family protein phosphatase [Kitasatospora sp. CMC57]|uniref:SpoIIE family protein phosphatase n=1 Tax=Kitasatospora sp. CMC57 TaxID=3231513 RepID=A0AB33JUT7_9ACTN